MPQMSKLQKNNAVLSALGHPLRRKILRMMETNNNGGLSPKMISDELEQSIGVVAYHVRLLAEAGVLTLVGTKQRRGAIEHFYARAGNAVDKRATEMLEFIGQD